MNILIKETNIKRELCIIDKNGINWIEDFIGNYGALQDGQFTYCDEKDVYICDQETFDWWDKVVDENQALNDRIDALKEEYGYDRVHNAIEHVDTDLEYLAAATHQALNDEFNDNEEN